MASERLSTMTEQLRKAQLVRDRLEGLDKLVGSSRRVQTAPPASPTSAASNVA